MKIGILTHHWVYNFGANLQALATQSALRSMGLDPIFINYREPSKVEMYRKTISAPQAEKHELFSSLYLRQSPLLECGREIEAYCGDNLDVVLVGSDAVFSLVPKYDPVNIFRRLRNKNFKVTQMLPPHWLNWENELKTLHVFKASIAASSMGTNYFFLSPKLRVALRKSISDFGFISVRDDWTFKMIRSLSKQTKPVEICPDPVFSLNTNFDLPEDEWIKVDASKTILMAGNFAAGWLGKFVGLAHSNGYKVANCPNPDNEFSYEQFDYRIKLPLSPLAFYSLLSHCAGYVGVRFHALVTCIANQTPVISIDPHKSAKFNKSGSKMFDLCRRAGIGDNFFTPETLCSQAPETVFELLFSLSGKRNADQYRLNAAGQFPAVLEKIVAMAADKMGRKP